MYIRVLPGLGQVIDEYNRYRSPEVTAKIEYIGEDYIDILFKGSFCYTCGFYDYFEDFIIEAREFGIILSLERIVEIGGGAIVRFKVEGGV
ncbi:MAG: hypothetical protein QW374_01820 [Candidatus Bathyarchaeia archaeon]|nr:hypothetical protein [Candidatus Bathyarchaeota archaeon]